MNDLSAAPQPYLDDPMPRRRLALLVDGENLAAARAAQCLRLARTLGDPSVCRVYGKLADLQAKGWATAHGFRLFPATHTKNSADLLLSVDAMELALDQRVDCIAIAASDNDYAHVALKLRERGFAVHGLIDQAAKCEALRAVYASVLVLPGQPVPALAGPPPANPVLPNPAPDALALAPRPAPVLTKADQTILAIMHRLAGPKGAVSIGRLGGELRDNGLSPKALGAASWSRYFKRSAPYLVKGEGSALSVAPA